MPGQKPIRATLLFLIDRSTDSVLLIRKKRGIGAGKINAPGGKIDPGETPAECAVRETREEVGLDLSDARLLGRLDDTLSPSRQRPPRLAISAFVFATPHTAPLLRPNVEVASTYWLHASRFLSQEGRTTMPFRWGDNDISLPAVYLEDAHIWGLTLRILDDLSSRIRKLGA